MLKKQIILIPITLFPMKIYDFITLYFISIYIFTSCVNTDNKLTIASSQNTNTLAQTLKIIIKGHDKRIDLRWETGSEVNSPDFEGYKIYYSTSSNPYNFQHRNIWDPSGVRKLNLYSDWIDSNNITFYYKIRVKTSSTEYDLYDEIASATTHLETDEEFLDGIQEQTFRYFYDGAHPVSGLTRERYPFTGDDFETCTTGGTGFGLMTFPVGVERGFISRENAALHVLKVLKFLDESSDRFHGAWPHWLYGSTGKVKLFGDQDGADLVETAYLIQGILTVRQYFNRTNSAETSIRNIADSLWKEEGNCVEWDWFRENTYGANTLTWHWSPTHGFTNSRAVIGYDETMITYILAIACPNINHQINISCYKNGYARGGALGYTDNAIWYGYPQYLGSGGSSGIKGMPLFWSHYSLLGFDPRGKNDGILPYGISYYDALKFVTLIDHAYCPLDGGFNANLWGLTASDNPWGYATQCPTGNNGTITPSAFLGAIIYLPNASIDTARYIYNTYTWRVWGEFGFKDAFNPSYNGGTGWFAESYIAIDQGPIVLMIENYRTQLLWNLFMSHQDIKNLLINLENHGWVID